MMDTPLFPPPAFSPPVFSLRAQALAAAGAGSAWDIADEAIRRKRAGEPLLMLTLGDPHGPPHPAIVAATWKALEEGRTHYSPLLGEPALRAAIASYCRQSWAEDTPLTADNIVVVHGAQHAAFALASVLAGPGDEVILSDPYYPTYPPVVAAAGATLVTVPAAPDFSLDVAAIERAITPRTRMLLLNSPCNPTGAAITTAQYRRLADLCTAHGIWLVVDEVYADFRFEGAHVSALPFGAFSADAPGCVIVINSFSKAFAMTGFRIGWIVAAPPVVAALRDWTSAALFGTSQFLQDGAVAALTLPRAEFAGYRGGFRQRAQLVLDRVAAIPGLRAEPPKGGMFVMLDHRALDPDDRRFARALLDELQVATVPGSGFGQRGVGHVRLSLAADEATIATAFDRIARFAQSYRPD